MRMRIEVSAFACGLWAALAFPCLAQPPNVLERLVELAVTTHPSIQAKQFDIQSSQAQVDAAKWQYYPTPSVLTERATNQTNKNVGITSSSTLRLQQPLWTGGRLDAGLQSATLKQRATEASLQETRLTTALQVVDHWQNLLIAQGRLQASAQLLAQLTTLGEMMDRRINQQISPAIEAQVLQTRRLQAQSDERLAQTAVATAIARLAQWAGEGAQTLLLPLQLAPSNSTPHLTQPLPAWPAHTLTDLTAAISKAPSLQRYALELQVAHEEVRLKQAERWPSVYARLDRSFNHYGNSGSNVADSTFYLGLQYTLGAGLSTGSLVHAAMARYQSLEVDGDTLRRQLSELYTREWRDYASAVERLQWAHSVQTGNTELLESSTRLFVAGKRSWLELLNTLREQNAANVSLTDLQAQAQASHFRLRLYLAELPWQTSSVPKEAR